MANTALKRQVMNAFPAAKERLAVRQRSEVRWAAVPPERRPREPGHRSALSRTV
ncbi:hypothetical protein ACIHCM_01870 [Streptomyces sp. NPDC052023]|uniref:hypothetical protein n=1 Tax=Streptomyces sp. NPDC052023 TaxID=3365681 RepID=UPI0037D199E6